MPCKHETEWTETFIRCQLKYSPEGWTTSTLIWCNTIKKIVISLPSEPSGQKNMSTNNPEGMLMGGILFKNTYITCWLRLLKKNTHKKQMKTLHRRRVTIGVREVRSALWARWICVSSAPVRRRVPFPGCWGCHTEKPEEEKQTADEHRIGPTDRRYPTPRNHSDQRWLMCETSSAPTHCSISRLILNPLHRGGGPSHVNVEIKKNFFLKRLLLRLEGERPRVQGVRTAPVFFKRWVQ